MGQEKKEEEEIAAEEAARRKEEGGTLNGFYGCINARVMREGGGREKGEKL